MKKKKLEKKLVVKKTTLTNLDHLEQYHIQAGGTVMGRTCDPEATDCGSGTCPCGETETGP